MKKTFLVIVAILCLGYLSSAEASTYDVNIFGLSDVYGFGFQIDTIAPNVSPDDFTITPGDAIPEASSGAFWQSWIATAPQLGVQGTDLAVAAPLKDGKILTISSLLDFTLSHFDLGGNTADGKYPNPFRVDLDEANSIYTYNPVPIPGAIWLLGSGLIGIVAIRRKRVKV